MARKLAPYLKGDLRELRKAGHQSDKYNRRVKLIPGCESCSFHSWRVYANTRMMEAGVDRAVRMRLLGHRAGKDDIHTGYTSVALKTMLEAVTCIT